MAIRWKRCSQPLYQNCNWTKNPRKVTKNFLFSFSDANLISRIICGKAAERLLGQSGESAALFGIIWREDGIWPYGTSQLERNDTQDSSQRGTLKIDKVNLQIAINVGSQFVNSLWRLYRCNSCGHASPPKNQPCVTPIKELVELTFPFMYRDWGLG